MFGHRLHRCPRQSTSHVRQKAVEIKDSRAASRWTYEAKLAIAGDVVAADDRVLVGSRSYDLIALDAASGKEPDTPGSASR